MGSGVNASINQSTLEQRSKLSPNSNHNFDTSSGFSSIAKQAGSGLLNDQEKEMKFPMNPR